MKDAARRTAQGLSDRFQSLLGTTENISDGASRAVACFRIFNPDNWPEDPVERSTYGEVELEHLLDWFSSRLHRHGCVLPAVVHQWRLYRQLVMSEFSDRNYTSIFSVILTKEPYRTDLCDLLHLMEIMLILPITSASCERVFSAQKRIKSDTRSSLNVDTVEDLIRISADGPSIDDFAPQPAVLRWLQSSQRARRPTYREWPTTDGYSLPMASSCSPFQGIVEDTCFDSCFDSCHC